MPLADRQKHAKPSYSAAVRGRDVQIPMQNKNTVPKGSETATPTAPSIVPPRPPVTWAEKLSQSIKQEDKTLTDTSKKQNYSEAENQEGKKAFPTLLDFLVPRPSQQIHPSQNQIWSKVDKQEGNEAPPTHDYKFYGSNGACLSPKPWSPTPSQINDGTAAGALHHDLLPRLGQKIHPSQNQIWSKVDKQEGNEAPPTHDYKFYGSNGACVSPKSWSPSHISDGAEADCIQDDSLPSPDPTHNGRHQCESYQTHGQQPVSKKEHSAMDEIHRKVIEDFTNKMETETRWAFSKFRNGILRTEEGGGFEICRHYLKMKPEAAMVEIFDKFTLLNTLIMAKGTTRLATVIKEFISVVKEDHFGRFLFHLAICISNSKLDEVVGKELRNPSHTESSPSKGFSNTKLDEVVGKEQRNPSHTETPISKGISYTKLDEVVGKEQRNPSHTESQPSKGISHSKLDEVVGKEQRNPSQTESPPNKGFSNTKLDEVVGKEQRNPSQTKSPPSKDTLVDSVKQYMDICKCLGPLSLANLNWIEEMVLADAGFPAFYLMGYGSFTQFLLTEANEMVKECGGLTWGTKSESGDSEMSLEHCRTDIHDFIRQCRETGCTQPSDIKDALCRVYGVEEISNLSCDNISELLGQIDKLTINQHEREFTGFRESSPVSCSGGQSNATAKVGIRGHQTRDAAKLCLHNCPLLADLAQWSEWSSVFETEHGNLTDFIKKYGGVTTLSIEGRLVKLDVLALEVRKGQLIKLVSDTSQKQVASGLESLNIDVTCGHLVSMVVTKGVDNMPMDFLSGHVTALLQMQAGALAIPLFVLKCLLRMPTKICVALANQIFLDPLGQVVGSTKSKQLLLQLCVTIQEKNQLRKLGCLLEIQEWTLIDWLID